MNRPNVESWAFVAVAALSIVITVVALKLGAS